MIRVIRLATRRIGSLDVTLGLLLAAAAYLLYRRWMDVPVGWGMALPLAGMGINLLAALASNKVLRTQGGLLVFHLALATVMLAASVGQLVQMEGHVEVTEGVAFDPQQVVSRAGPLHNWKLDRANFVQGRFSISYGPGMNRRETVSHVILKRDEGRGGAAQIGDDKPLIIQGYRFYTTFNKGFAPEMTFVDGQGRTMRGVVHLPSYPLFEYKQTNDWQPPGADEPIKFWLKMPRPVFNEKTAWRFRKPENPRLVVIDRQSRRELRLGESVEVSGGRIRFDGLRTWMGYKIRYDPASSWVLAASIIAVLGLIWHIVAKFFASPWHMAESERKRLGA